MGQEVIVEEIPTLNLANSLEPSCSIIDFIPLCPAGPAFIDNLKSPNLKLRSS